jgi:hypothetical protein
MQLPKFEDFVKEMSGVEKTDEVVFGRISSGNSRATFNFQGCVAYLESFGFPRFQMKTLAQTVSAAFRPCSSRWITDYMVHGKTRAEEIAKAYGAIIEETPYALHANKWFHFVFPEDNDGKGFDKLMLWVYDRLNGEFEKKFGKETIEFKSCFGET